MAEKERRVMSTYAVTASQQRDGNRWLGKSFLWRVLLLLLLQGRPCDECGSAAGGGYQSAATCVTNELPQKKLLAVNPCRPHVKEQRSGARDEAQC